MSETKPPSSTSPASRLLNVVIALVNTTAPMTKQQIRRNVVGYADAPSVEAFERMFERDKDTLRELSIPIVTVDGGGHSDDIGYRIDGDAYALPPIDLTSAEFGVLSLAAQFWQDKTLRTDSVRGLTKLRATGSDGIADDVVAGLAPQVRPIGDNYGPLLEAISQRRAITFTYHAANTGEVRERIVEPWRIAARGGGWYLVGFDRERQAPRAFRLTRIEGRVRGTGPAATFTVPAHVDVDELLGAGGTAGVARLAILPERAAALRARGTALGVTAAGDRDLIEVLYTSLTSIRDEIVGYADAVVVQAPVELRESVLRRLRDAVALGGANDG